MSSTTDRIEKQVFLQATPSRVWRALSDPEEFGTWFGVRLEGSFAPGERVHGQITYPGCEHMHLEMWVESMLPERLFSYRWHPCEEDAQAANAEQLTTLVEFHLEAQEGGTQLRVVESGFDRLPAERRAMAFARNAEGWAIQMGRIEEHVSTS